MLDIIMNTTQIQHILEQNENTRKNFTGVYSRNMLRNIEHSPRLVVCNTDPSYKPGKHWILFYFHDNIVDFYDPLGRKPEEYGIEFIEFMKEYASNYKICFDRTQPLNSNLCGHYCIWYANMCTQQYSMSYIVNNLPDACTIKMFAEKYLLNEIFCKLGQKCISY